jgi:hypothetical protein
MQMASVCYFVLLYGSEGCKEQYRANMNGSGRLLWVGIAEKSSLNVSVPSSTV